MTLRGERASEGEYEGALDGTVYWTLSLYVEPEAVAAALDLENGTTIEPEVVRRVQMRHLPSSALRNAIDPLFNDIADRETQGEVHEFLLAASSADCASMDEAAALVRECEDIIFEVPRSISWETEGVRFHAHPADLDHLRLLKLRRFWFAHNHGGLSYHLSFSHYFGSFRDEDGDQRDGHDPATYYFLSMLQKLGAPKEYALSPGILDRISREPESSVEVFGQGDLGIAPLDNLRVRGKSGETRRFWSFVKERFETDARNLFPRLADQVPGKAGVADGFEKKLLDLVPVIEVPGLKLPKLRFMFMIQDSQFFDRLLPSSVEENGGVSQSQMVNDLCYAPFQARIADLKKSRGSSATTEIHLGGPDEPMRPGARAQPDFWTWVETRPEYGEALAAGMFARTTSGQKEDGTDCPTGLEPIPEGDLKGLAEAMRAGQCFEVRDETGRPLARPVRHYLPAFEPGRTDCLDYLFLAGFNQNIIDFMNQDTSEILDGIDPLYPPRDRSTDERFYVRYANHRAMITYVPKSRSLEIGNDYIGTCPYAFLIHVLALHNEFLARSHEEKSLARIERIGALVAGRQPRDSSATRALEKREPLPDSDDYTKAEIAINQAKLAEFREYERFRYANPFRYDTERAIFHKLEELRGTIRKKRALTLALESLEDHAADLERRHQRLADEASARRETRLNILLGGTGVFGAGQMIYWMGELALGDAKTGEAAKKLALLPEGPETGKAILWATELAMWVSLFVFVPLLLWIVFDTAWQTVISKRTNRPNDR